MTEPQPLVSIVIPCYNHENYVQESIQSVIEQDYDNIELIIIDDGSSDNSVTKIEEMISACQQRFKRFEFRYRPNKGLCATLNEALEWCEGEFYSALASDDIILSHKVRVQVDHLNANESCVAVFGKANLINENSSVVGQNNNKAGKLFFKDIMLVKSSVCAPTQMIRLDKLKATGGYQKDFYIEDFYMWLKLTENGEYLENISDMLAKYRRHDSNISSELNKMHLGRVEIINQYKTHALYNRAMASVFLSFAIDTQPVNKYKSIKILASSINKSIFILFDKRIFKFSLKIILPRAIIIYLIRSNNHCYAVLNLLKTSRPFGTPPEK